jgi:ABC-2 type transport system permease protein
MKKTLIVMGNELRATLARKAFLALSLGLPLLVGVVVLAIILVKQDTGSPSPADAGDGTTGAPQPVGYVDPGALVQTIPSDVPTGWFVPFSDEAAAQAAMEAGEIGAYYLIPVDYLESGDLTYVQQEYGILSNATPDHGPMEWVLLVNLFGGDEAEATGALHPVEVNWQQLPSPGASQEGEGGDSWLAELLPSLLAFLLYMAILIPASTLVSTVTDEKKNRVMEILLSSVSPGQLISGKILALGLLGLLQTALWGGVLWSVARLGGQALGLPHGFEIPPVLLVWCVVYSLLGYAMYGSQMAGLGALAPDVKDTSFPTMVVMAPMILVYMFLAVIVQRPDSALSITLSLFPLTSPVAMMARLTADAVPVWQPILAAILQLLTSILIVRAVARLFHAQTLLSGQALSLKTYGKALLGRT